MKNISVVLIEPEHPGNLGAIARIMKNFDFTNLVLINPKCSPEDIEAVKRAKHAKYLLKKAKVKDFSYLDKFDYLIATTSKLGTDYNIPRSPITPEKLATQLRSKNAKVALLFGREGIGLTNDEILQCDYTISIPSSKKYPALNLSHSVAIILYELYKQSGERKITKGFITATKKEKDQMLKLLNQVLDNLNFTTKDKKQTQRIVWKRIFGKSMLTKREAYAVMGFFKKLL
ncbi:RNA methyltransferase [Candidatus Woesearchaeota archaeon]|nr:RNA methyltransferase [Candidatus Woesearchaeota archaeon]